MVSAGKRWNSQIHFQAENKIQKITIILTIIFYEMVIQFLHFGVLVINDGWVKTDDSEVKSNKILSLVMGHKQLSTHKAKKKKKKRERKKERKKEFFVSELVYLFVLFFVLFCF